jgi:hypothetical protein
MFRVRAAIGAHGGDMAKTFSSNARYAAKGVAAKFAAAKGAAAKTKRAAAPAKVKAERKAAQRAPRAEVASKPVAKDPSPGSVLSS